MGSVVVEWSLTRKDIHSGCLVKCPVLVHSALGVDNP